MIAEGIPAASSTVIASLAPGVQAYQVDLLLLLLLLLLPLAAAWPWT